MKHKENFNKKKINLISWVSFLMGFSQAFFVYIMSSYFQKLSGRENVGEFYLFAYIIILICFLNLHRIVKKIGKSETFHLALLGKVITLLFLLFAQSSWTRALLAVSYIIFNSLETVSLDIILEAFSSDKMSGRIRGKFLTLLNAGFLLAPFLSMLVLERYDFYGIFLTLLILNTAVFFFSLFNIKVEKKADHQLSGGLTSRDIVKRMIQRKNIRKIFYISFVLEFFYALMVIYTPIYLINLGFSWEKIGTIFTFMLVPFVLLQYPMGILADKKTGEKELIIVAIFIMGLATLVIYFIDAKSILVWSIILFSTRIGAALIEILRDSYFYKRIDGSDVDLINIFRTAMPVAYILAAAVSALILILFPLKSVFILVGVVVLSALWPAWRLSDNKCEAELKKLTTNDMMRKS